MVRHHLHECEMQYAIQIDAATRDNAGNDAVNLFLIEPPVIYRAIVACKCQPIGMGGQMIYRISRIGASPVPMIDHCLLLLPTDRLRIPCQTQTTRYCFYLTATGSLAVVLECTK